MILIVGNARPVPAARDRLVNAAREISAATQADEGCLFYTFAASLEDESIISIELWRDHPALDAHMEHEHTHRFLDSLDGVLDGAPVMNQAEL